MPVRAGLTSPGTQVFSTGTDPAVFIATEITVGDPNA